MISRLYKLSRQNVTILSQIVGILLVTFVLSQDSVPRLKNFLGFTRAELVGFALLVGLVVDDCGFGNFDGSHSDLSR